MDGKQRVERRTSVLRSSVVGAILMLNVTSTVHRSPSDCVIGMCFDMLLEVLRSLERLSAERAVMRFQRHMYSNMRRHMIAFLELDVAGIPCARQIEIVCALATDMLLAEVVLYDRGC